MKNLYRFLFAGIALCLSASIAFSQDANLGRTVMGSGGMVGETNSAGITMSGITGQTAIGNISGQVDGKTIDIFQGFWVPTEKPVSVEEQPGPSEKLFELANYPNPFSHNTIIRFHLPAGGEITLKVYNLMGDLISQPYSGPAEEGLNEIAWEARDIAGTDLSSGSYIYELTYKPYGSRGLELSRNIMSILK